MVIVTQIYSNSDTNRTLEYNRTYAAPFAGEVCNGNTQKNPSKNTSPASWGM